MRDGSGPGEWRVVKRVRNPWGRVTITDRGRFLPGAAEQYFDQLVATTRALDTPSRRHHYVPRAYLRAWAADERKRRIWTVDTVAGTTRPLGISDVCVRENFHRVNGQGGEPHNRVELMFGVVDMELARVQRLFSTLTEPDSVEYEDFLALCVVMSMQRMRTLQERRLQQQYNLWLNSQNPEDFPLITDSVEAPNRLATFVTRSIFEAMWSAADVLLTRQIEVWEDPAGRFATCDVPVLVPFGKGLGRDLNSTPHIVWPISPTRAIALTLNTTGEKVEFRREKHLVGVTRSLVETCRERMIFTTADQKDGFAKRNLGHRRAQTYLTCSRKTPQGDHLDPPGCCVKWAQTIAAEPVVNLCRQGLHRPVPDFSGLT